MSYCAAFPHNTPSIYPRYSRLKARSFRSFALGVLVVTQCDLPDDDWSIHVIVESCRFYIFQEDLPKDGSPCLVQEFMTALGFTNDNTTENGSENRTEPTPTVRLSSLINKCTSLVCRYNSPTGKYLSVLRSFEGQVQLVSDT